ncbi:hypothetical protein [Amycolatopsis sp. MtRt-6]|uniref:hypothetical protein n=1 Tax=Amycolatopsis sp. MtRt-6 TaxID=2792782 RepID=UPI001A8F1569|nr:hypothetical protein [Amycolatopsis sp. MtRt-6]
MDHDTRPDSGSLTRRAVNMLKAVRDGRAQLSLGCEPDLYVDGIPCCDQATARTLGRLGLIAANGPGRLGELVPAVVTKAGQNVLAATEFRVAG